MVFTTSPGHLRQCPNYIDEKLPGWKADPTQLGYAGTLSDEDLAEARGKNRRIFRELSRLRRVWNWKNNGLPSALLDDLPHTKEQIWCSRI